jgi:hypothetical protein
VSRVVVCTPTDEFCLKTLGFSRLLCTGLLSVTTTLEITYKTSLKKASHQSKSHFSKVGEFTRQNRDTISGCRMRHDPHMQVSACYSDAKGGTTARCWSAASQSVIMSANAADGRSKKTRAQLAPTA